MNPPYATIDEVWRQRQAWASVSRSGKKSQDFARYWALLAGLIGSALATITPHAKAFCEDGPAIVGLLATLVLAVAGYLGRTLVTADRENQWTRARILSEALKRECWRCAMSVAPYDGEDAGAVLRRTASDFAANMTLDRAPIPPLDPDRIAEATPTSSPDGAPRPKSAEDYLRQRALEQAAYYEQTAAGHRKRLRTISRLSFFVGLSSLVFGILGTHFPGLLVLVPIATMAAAAVAAWIQTQRLAPTIELYQQTAAQLALQSAAWHDARAQREKMSPDLRAAALVELVTACEGIMSRENNSWQAEWMNEEKVAAAIESVQGVASGKPQSPPPNA